MKLVVFFARAYPGRTWLMLLCLLLAGLAEGVGLSSLLPLIGLAADAGAAAPGAQNTGFGADVLQTVRGLGIEPTMGFLLVVVVVGMVLKATLVLLAKRQVGNAVAHVATDLRLGLIRALLRTRWEYYVHQPLGTFSNAVATEADRGSHAYLHAATLMSFSVEALVYAAIALLVSLPAALAALVGGSVIVLAFNRLVHMSRRAGNRQTRLVKSLSGQLIDTLQAVKPLKAMARESLIAPLLEGETRRLKRALRREVLSKEALNALQEPLIVTFLAGGLYVSFTWWSLPLPNMIMLALLCGRMLASLGAVQKEVQRLAHCESAFWSIRAMVAEAEAAQETKTGKAAPHLRREIRLEHVRFAYEKSWVLDDASLTIAAGELTVLIGPSGGGKTTVADLIIGLLEPQHGRVLLDGVSLDTIDARRWRESIGYVPQETFLLHDTVIRNITLGDPDLTPAEVESALRAAGAWEFVANLPEGAETIVGERGLRISGGQRQRIALARALVRQPRLLVLDEATSALDAATETSICGALEELRGAMTILAVSHRGPLFEVADRVYRVENGAVTPVTGRSKVESLAAAAERSRAKGGRP